MYLGCRRGRFKTACTVRQGCQRDRLLVSGAFEAPMQRSALQTRPSTNLLVVYCESCGIKQCGLAASNRAGVGYNTWRMCLLPKHFIAR